MRRRSAFWETAGWIMALAALFLAWIVLSRKLEESREAPAEAVSSGTQKAVGSIPSLLFKRRREPRAP